MFSLMGNFGWRGTPFAWAVIGRALMVLVHRALIEFCLLYVDDFMVATHKQSVKDDFQTIHLAIGSLLGPLALAPKKDEHGRNLVFIGWWFCLDRRVVSVSTLNLAKTMWSLLSIDPFGKVARLQLEALAFRCSRYAQISPHMKPHTISFHRDVAGFSSARSPFVTHRLSAGSRDDILIWRAFLTMVAAAPEAYARPLESFRQRPHTVIFGMDGCLTGMGAYVALKDPYTPGVRLVSFIQILLFSVLMCTQMYCDYMCTTMWLGGEFPHRGGLPQNHMKCNDDECVRSYD